MRIKILNWQDRQHYKDRRPPWIKLHVSCMTDRAFMALPSATKWHFEALSLFVSHNGENGEVDVEPDDLCWWARLPKGERMDLEAMEKANLIKLVQDASTTLADASTVEADASNLPPRDREETETEAETEGTLPVVARLPTNVARTEYEVTEKDALEWESLYPAVNVRNELAKMRGWLLANPAKRKTKTGMPRFINAWLSREQDKGGKSQQSMRLDDLGDTRKRIIPDRFRDQVPS